MSKAKESYIEMLKRNPCEAYAEMSKLQQPGPGHGDDLQSAIFCLRCWDSNVRIIGNVRVSTLLGLLEEVERLRAENAAYERAYPKLSGRTGPA